jgi:hypothetical protein
MFRVESGCPRALADFIERVDGVRASAVKFEDSWWPDWLRRSGVRAEVR